MLKEQLIDAATELAFKVADTDNMFEAVNELLFVGELEVILERTGMLVDNVLTDAGIAAVRYFLENAEVVILEDYIEMAVKFKPIFESLID